jgi:hypothetical protein
MDWKLNWSRYPSRTSTAKAFYAEQAGFNLDHDHVLSDELRFVQLTPPGSACSIAIGLRIADSAPGSANLQLVVPDIEAAPAGGREVGEIEHFPGARSSSSTTRRQPDRRQKLPRPRRAA